MLMAGLDTLRTAHRQGWAVGAFSIYNLELAQGVLRAAEGSNSPVILQAGSSAFRYAGEEPLAALTVAAARCAAVPVGVHLDHSRQLDECRRCLDAGYTSVMVDGSHLEFGENVALTRAAVDLAERYGAWVEAELGEVPGNEDRSTAASAAAGTDPAQAEKFVEETGVAALAVAIGNVHGLASRPVRLDLDRLDQIRARVCVPLVLHGASGQPIEQLQSAIRRGVAKVNVNAEVRRAYLAALRRENSGPGDDIAGAMEFAIQRATAVVGDKIGGFRSTWKD